MWYRDLSGAVVNWGVTYSQSQTARLEAADPNASYTNLKNFVDGTGYSVQPQMRGAGPGQAIRGEGVGRGGG